MTLCVSEADLSEQVRLGAGAVLLTDDSLGQEPLQELRAVLDRQPSWSELPILLLARPESPRLDSLRGIPGVVLLERPVNVRSLLSALQAALRARLRQ